MAPPLVTISMPYYGCPQTVRRAVEAVLAQDFADWLLVVVNDGGDPAEVWRPLDGIDDPRVIRYNLPENRGRYFADAVVLAACDTPWFTVHDADDEAHVDWLSTMFAAVTGDGTVGGLDYVSTAQRVQSPQFDWGVEFVKPRVPRPPVTHYAHMAGLWSTRWLRDVAGGMHPAYRVGYDSLLSMIATEYGRGYDIASPLYDRHRRAGSLTRAASTGYRSAHRRDARVKMVDLWRRIQAHPAAPADIVRGEAAELWREVEREAFNLSAGLADAATTARAPEPEVIHEPAATTYALAYVVDPAPWQRPWAFSRGAAAELDRFLADKRPRTIVEFGSGSSTLVLAAYAHATGASLTVLEHLPRYAGETAKLLAANGIPVGGPVQIKVAPLRQTKLGPVYAVDDLGLVDLALVDGPPEKEGGRVAVVQQLASLLADGGTIWLDDAERPIERKAIELWLKGGPSRFADVRDWGRPVALLTDDPLQGVRAGSREPLPRWANEVVVTLLTGRRPDLLEKTLPGVLNLLWQGAHVVGLVNDPADLRSAEMLAGTGVRVVREINEALAIGPAVAACARLAIESGRPYWLHIEDDWAIDTLDERWLDRAIAALDAMAGEIAQVRLRHVGEPVLTRHMVTRKPIRWRAVSSLGVAVADAHATFNPTLVRTLDIAPLYVDGLTGERQAQHLFELRYGVVAQLYPGAFRHIGGGDSLADRTGGR